MEKQLNANQDLKEEESGKIFSQVVKKHKKQIMIAATATGIVIVGVVIFKKKDTIKALRTGNVAHVIAENSDNIRLISSSPIEGNIITEYSISNVKGFRRNLPAGQKASPGKIELASELGIELGENQTLVNPFIRRIKSNQYVA